MYGYIYLTTNLVNGKLYVGQHISSAFDSKYKGSGKALINAFHKYGKDNFETHIICECENIEELNAMEMHFIEEYSSTNKDIGYNIRTGGNNSPWDNDTKKKMSDSAKGKVFSNESRIKMSRSKIGNHNNHACNRGKCWVNNGVEQFFVSPELVEHYSNLGYKRGMIPKTAEELDSYRKLFSDRVFINNSFNEKYVHKDEVPGYISEGWVVGRLNVYTEKRGANISKSKKGAIRVTDGNRVKYIKPELLDDYEEIGFHRTHKKNTP